MFKKIEEMVKRNSSFIFQILFSVFLLVYSICILLAQFEVINMSPIFYARMVLEFLLILFGMVMIVDSVKNKQLPEKNVTLALGVVVILFGALPLFHSIGMLKFLPIIIFLNVNPLILTIILLFSAFYFVVDRILLLFN